jgi:hypothetical protein
LKFLRGLRDLRGEKPALPGLQNTEKNRLSFSHDFPNQSSRRKKGPGIKPGPI